MKKIALILWLIVPLALFGQSRIGRSEEAIVNEFTDVKFKKDKLSNGQDYISGVFNHGIMGYYLDDNGYCVKCIYVVYELPSLNYLVELYNNNYVIVSNREWKAYVKGGEIVYINLHQQDDYFYFVYK